MRAVSSYAPVVALALIVMVPSVALAQTPDPSPSRATCVSRDSLAASNVTLAGPDSPTQRLTGRARISLDASALRLDGGGFNTYSVAASAVPMLGEHLQIGVAPSYERFDGTQYTSQNVATGVIANYVFGGDARWRGYVGGYGSFAAQTNAPGTRVAGAQGGALFFITPAVALRSELRYRENTSPNEQRYGSVVALITLDPYVSGSANEVTSGTPGIGVFDLAVLAFHEQYSSYHESGISGTIAPYLTRWAQVGAEGEAEHFSDLGGLTYYRLRGFGRGYVPLTTRTQPFVEGFAETTTEGGSDGGLTDYGAALGVREMLNGNVALDVGLRRTLRPTDTVAIGGRSFSVRFPASAALFAGVVTRLGRAR